MQTVTLDPWPADRTISLGEDDEISVTTRLRLELERSDDSEPWRVTGGEWVDKVLWHDGSAWGDLVETHERADPAKQIRLWLAKPHIAERHMADIQRAADEQWLLDREGE